MSINGIQKQNLGAANPSSLIDNIRLLAKPSEEFVQPIKDKILQNIQILRKGGSVPKFRDLVSPEGSVEYTIDHKGKPNLYFKRTIPKKLIENNLSFSMCDLQDSFHDESLKKKLPFLAKPISKGVLVLEEKEAKSKREILPQFSFKKPAEPAIGRVSKCPENIFFTSSLDTPHFEDKLESDFSIIRANSEGCKLLNDIAQLEKEIFIYYSFEFGVIIKGDVCFVGYNPYSVTDGVGYDLKSLRIQPDVALFHELLHAYHILQGTELSTDSRQQDIIIWSNDIEWQVIEGIQAEVGDQYVTENSYRRAGFLPERFGHTFYESLVSIPWKLQHAKLVLDKVYHNAPPSLENPKSQLTVLDRELIDKAVLYGYGVYGEQKVSTTFTLPIDPLSQELLDRIIFFKNYSPKGRKGSLVLNEYPDLKIKSIGIYLLEKDCSI